ncbi:hypothetical protein DL765_002320 [Monosporascus sp. GIB2]|nr:hypothetical protein DL765_002320 [Monosporascus sp. GIB2]
MSIPPPILSSGCYPHRDCSPRPSTWFHCGRLSSTRATTVIVVGSSQLAAAASASAFAPAVPQAPSVGVTGPSAERNIPIAGPLADMLQDFAPEDVNRSSCNDLAELCANNRPNADIGQIVFVCMEISRPPSNSWVFAPLMLGFARRMLR